MLENFGRSAVLVDGLIPDSAMLCLVFWCLSRGRFLIKEMGHFQDVVTAATVIIHR